MVAEEIAEQEGRRAREAVSGGGDERAARVVQAEPRMIFGRALGEHRLERVHLVGILERFPDAHVRQVSAPPVDTDVVMQEAGQFLAQSRLLLLRSQNGVVRIQNSAFPIADDNIPIHAPLLSLFSCPTPVGFSFSGLSQP